MSWCGRLVGSVRVPEFGHGEADRRSRRFGVTKCVETHEVVDGAVEAHGRRRDAGIAELVRVRLALVAEYVVFVDDDESGWQTFKVRTRGLQRRDGYFSA